MSDDDEEETPTCIYCGEPLAPSAPTAPYCSTLCATNAQHDDDLDD